MTDTAANIVQPFLLDSGISRGQAVRLTSVLDTMINQHGYPETVGKILCETAVLTALLASTIKYDGTFTLQVQSSGAISSVVVDLTYEGKMRGYVRYDAEALKKAEHDKDETKSALTKLIGYGTLAFTTEHKDQRYQGVIGLEGSSLTECVLNYFRQSEQIATDVKLAVAAPTKERGWIAGAVLLQKMPYDTKMAQNMKAEVVEELWETETVLLSSLRDSEITDSTLGLEKLLFRLYHQNDLHFFMPKTIEFGCRCSQEKVIEMLKRFSPQDREQMVVDGAIKIDCQFCGKSYTLTLKDLGE